MAEELLRDFEFQITELAIVPSDGGKFEVMLDDKLIYSKKRTGRHAEYAEVAAEVRKNLVSR